MISTVLIDHDDVTIDYYVNDAPPATVNGDFLIAFEAGGGSSVTLSHKSSIAENGGKTSFLFVYSAFFFFLFLYFALDT